jgi:beta-glucosidase-like glycosyl hydrolase
MNPARLLFPAIRWSAATGYTHEAAAIDRALRRGAGGFILFGGPAAEASTLIEELRRRSATPLLVGADLERGAGQQFAGATRLPPLAALGAVDDLAATRAAGEVTGRDALAIGVDLVFAPVADLDAEPRNPIVGARAFGADPGGVARHVAAWIEGCRAAGALACAKHFPGHGRTTEDSHAALPRVRATRVDLDRDLEPFRAAIRSGVDALMTAHVVYDALDTDAPATLSPRILQRLLRAELGFTGFITTDALNMKGAVHAGGGEAAAAVAALAAGCDALLYPDDFDGAADALEAAAVRHGHTRIAESIGRLETAGARVQRAAARGGTFGRRADDRMARAIGCRSITMLRGEARVRRAFDLLTIDDDVGGPYAPASRDVLPAALRQAGMDVRTVDSPAAGGRPLVVAVFCDVRAWKGRFGLGPAALSRVGQIARTHPTALAVLFGHPRAAGDLPWPDCVGAWGGESLMQEAAADWMAQRSRGTFPA